MHPSLNFDRDVLPVVESLAQGWFQKRPDSEDLVADATSIAWEFFQRAPADSTPQSLAWYAIRWIRMGRQFPEKQRSITGPNYRGLAKPARDELVDVLVRRDANPAEIAQIRMDFEAWLGDLTERQKRFLEAFLMGERTSDIAERMKVSWARVSQLRGELVASWQAFTG